MSMVSWWKMLSTRTFFFCRTVHVCVTRLLCIDLIVVVIMPASAMVTLASLKVTFPMMFELKNPTTSQKTHVGVLEFSAEEVRKYIYFVFSRLVLSFWHLSRLG